MRNWGITLLVPILVVLVGGCSSTSPESTLAFVPGADTPAADARGASALSWGSPIALNNGGGGKCLAMVDGYPAASYVAWGKRGKTASFTLYYRRANDATGTSWGRAKALDNWPAPPNGGYNQYTILTVVNGYPAIGYVACNGIPGTFGDGSTRDLRYVRASDPIGKKWGAPLEVDVDGDNGVAESMLVVNGNPAITYGDYGSGAKYVRALDQNGETWGTPVYPIPSSGDLSFSLAIVSGRPAVACGGTRFLRADDVDGSSWTGTPISVPIGDMIQKLIVADGNPAIVTSGNGLVNGATRVRFIRALNPEGTLWPAGPVMVSDNTTSDWLGSIAIVNGLPAVAYTSAVFVGFDDFFGWPIFEQQTLKFVQAVDPSGSAWEAPQTIKPIAAVRIYPELTEVGAGAGIIFTDEADVVTYVYGQ